MTASAVIGLISRRGNVVLWEHATPASGLGVDPITRQPKLAAGGPRAATGPMGETYAAPVAVRAYFSNKVSSIFMAVYGTQQVGDGQLDIAVPFTADLALGIAPLPAGLVPIFNGGAFCAFPHNDPLGANLTLVARDRWTVNGRRYVVKAAAVPIQDQNTTVAWRILIGADTL